MPVDTKVPGDLLTAMNVKLPRAALGVQEAQGVIQATREILNGKRVQVMAKDGRVHTWELLEFQNDTALLTDDPHMGEHVREGIFVTPHFASSETDLVLRITDSDETFSNRYARYYKIKAEHVHQLVQWPE